jgi:hypothetical protein
MGNHQEFTETGNSLKCSEFDRCGVITLVKFAETGQ